MDTNTQNVVGMAQYDALRIELADRMEEQSDKHRKEMREQQELFVNMQNKIIESKDRDLKSWKIACITSMVILFLVVGGLIGGALYLANNFEFESCDYAQDVESGNANFIGHDGDINGETMD